MIKYYTRREHGSDVKHLFVGINKTADLHVQELNNLIEYF
jgi:hypothetical protein